MLALLHTTLSFCIVAALVVAAASDLKARIIPNRLVLFVAAISAAMVLQRLANGVPMMDAAMWPFVCTLAVFTAGVALFATGMMGGGDVKLITALTLGLPTASVLPFLFLMAVFGGFVALLTALTAAYQKSWLQLAEIETGFSAECATYQTITQVPYGVAIAAAGITVIAMPLLA